MAVRRACADGRAGGPVPSLGVLALRCALKATATVLHIPLLYMITLPFTCGGGCEAGALFGGGVCGGCVHERLRRRVAVAGGRVHVLDGRAPRIRADVCAAHRSMCVGTCVWGGGRGRGACARGVAPRGGRGLLAPLQTLRASPWSSRRCAPAPRRHRTSRRRCSAGALPARGAC